MTDDVFVEASNHAARASAELADAAGQEAASLAAIPWSSILAVILSLRSKLGPLAKPAIIAYVNGLSIPQAGKDAILALAGVLFGW